MGRDERQFHKVFNDAMDDAVNYLDFYYQVHLDLSSMHKEKLRLRAILSFELRI